MSLLDDANAAALAQVRPQQFTVGAYIDAEGKFRGVVTYDRKWSNGWGATAYARAWWDDLSVTAHPRWDAGAEVTRRF